MRMDGGSGLEIDLSRVASARAAACACGAEFSAAYRSTHASTHNKLGIAYVRQDRVR